MSNFTLTDQERAAFGQDITRNRALDYFYVFDNVPLQFIYRDRLIPGELTNLEVRNKAITATLWLDARHNGFDTKLFHADRLRMQLPLQKCSFSLDVANDVEAIVRQAAPDRKIRLGPTYAKGNQVVVEGVVCWNSDDIPIETPFISFLLLDKDGFIIRERRYPTIDNWPGADKLLAHLGLGE